MISLKNLRKTPELFKLKLSLKNDPIDVDIILDLDNKSRQHQTIINELRAKRNSASESIGIAKKAGDDASNAISEMRELGDHLKTVENQLQIVEEKLTTLLYQIPNLPHDSVPQGKNEMDNVEVRYWGEKPSFSFTPKTHLDITDNLSLLDLKRGAKISGSGFPLYTGNGAKLERALINSMLDHHVSQFGFKELAPPVLMRKESMLTTGQLPKFSEDMYHTEIDNLYLAPTAEVPVTNVHRDEVLDESELPVYYVAYTPCFRRESGSYGKDTRGLLRVHQFNKVELVKFTTPETSYDELESLTLQAETILQQLGLHYRVIELCTGDMSFAAAKCYDIEIWAPGENNWLEVSSCSNFESFQARRGNIRYRKTDDKKVGYLHTLNGSGVATPRLMVALLETYQQEDGTIQFPDEVANFLGISEIR
ncbi:MAG: serine--tRNA ligase [Candidatus Marinimicrobia bacterium]|jgi:seryl-tRNA synthetase|nr:serine--tRNA ligase [Candidatus Neomarinimicrobiota bacterium]MBT3501877.1 serine--tRNA ligase [Candidatus Neomarinimicrobiota bacterium]MBT3838597.1 serine--tRNA ligase [Candidatus Neomarinimicrobiota bacterium]MBT3999789.1 serine--tRNA ligase [Candidatus Neomarinimicrobiota bacterium]MBT4281844.1 serine--tRNA ligase [Candidatus Neomarinimicrobiota bacterium]